MAEKRSDQILETVYADALTRLSYEQPDSNAYLELLDRVSKLNSLKTEEKSKRVSPDTLVVCATNILGILLVTRFERAGVVTSKALGIAIKPR